MTQHERTNWQFVFKGHQHVGEMSVDCEIRALEVENTGKKKQLFF